MITETSQQLRDLITTDQVLCYCDVQARTEKGEAGHAADCLWLATVRAIYREERKADETIVL